MGPANFKNRILIAVSGMSPQIVTETLYALVTRAENPFIPTEVHIITTTDGANNAELNLLKKDKIGWFNKLCQELNLSKIDFTVKNIHIIKDKQTGKCLDDIRSPEDNEIAASFITEFIREKSKDPKSALHVSIAGGRKTMGYYMGYALSLFGRQQDRLSHVLVSEKYEGNPDFYYPSKNADIIYTRDGKPLEPAKAKVILADIPFLRINNDEAKNTMKGYSFSETITATQELLKPASLEIDKDNHQLIANGHIIKLADQRFAFYCWIVENQCNHAPIKTPDEKTKHVYAAVFTSLLENICSDMKDTDKTINAFDGGMKAKYIQETVAKIKIDIIKQIGNIASEPFIIKGMGKPASYIVSVLKDNISVI